MVADLDAESLRFTHFGETDDVAGHLDRARAMLAAQGELSSRGDREQFMAGLERWIDDQDPEAAERMRQAMPPEQVWMGLERYWRKRAERG